MLDSCASCRAASWTNDESPYSSSSSSSTDRDLLPRQDNNNVNFRMLVNMHFYSKIAVKAYLLFRLKAHSRVWDISDKWKPFLKTRNAFYVMLKAQIQLEIFSFSTLLSGYV